MKSKQPTKVPELIKSAKTIVIKIGSVLIRDPKTNTVRKDWFEAFANDIQTLHKSGKKIIIVSSGAVALGRETLGISLNTPPDKIPLEQKQASSAIGQFHLFAAYFEAFSKRNLNAAQVLLTISETENRRLYLNARETLSTLLDAGVIPIINENDAISTGEIRFGDNDRLAVRVGQMMNTDLVVLMSTIDGLYTDDPTKDPGAQHIPVVEKLSSTHEDMAGEAIPGLSTGGMKSKIQAAQAATQAGIDLVIANGEKANSLQSLIKGESRSTWFKAEQTKPGARKIWIQSHLKPKGTATIDKGAEKALTNGSSLLPVGVISISGDFERGDVIEIANEAGQKLGLGLSAYSSKDAGLIIGQNREHVHTIQGYMGRDELIHRNDLVLINSTT